MNIVPPVPRILSGWFDGDPPAACVLMGASAGLAGFVVDAWSARLDKDGVTHGVRRLTPEDFERKAEIGAVMLFRSPSFFESRRFFHLPDYGDIRREGKDDLKAYLADSDPTATVVLPYADGNTKTKTFDGLRGVKVCSAYENQVRDAFVEAVDWRAKLAGKRMTREAAVFLVEWVGLDYGTLREEVVKLAGFAGPKEEVGPAEIEMLCSRGGRFNAFDFGQALLGGDEKAVGMFREFCRANYGDLEFFKGELIRLVGAVAFKARQTGGARTGSVLSALSRLDRKMKGESRLSPDACWEYEILKLVR